MAAVSAELLGAWRLMTVWTLGRVTGESALSNLGGAAPTRVCVLELHIPEVGTIKFRQLL